MANAIMSFETILRTEDSTRYIDRAVEIIRESGVKYSVGSLDTLMEGDLEQLLDIVKKVMLELSSMDGNPGITSLIKIQFDPRGLSSEELTERYR